MVNSPLPARYWDNPAMPGGSIVDRGQAMGALAVRRMNKGI